MVGTIKRVEVYLLKPAKGFDSGVELMRHPRSTIERALSSELQISQHEAQKILSMFIESLAGALAAGGEVRLRGFGAFRVAAKQKDHSPGAPIRKCVKFRSSKHLKSLVQAVAEHDPILALLRQQVDSENSVESMLEQHARWCEDKAADRPNMALIDLEGRRLFFSLLPYIRNKWTIDR